MPSEEFWDEHYRNEKTPWDYGGVQPEFHEFLKTHREIKTLLVPGCGSGHEVSAAHEANLDVTGIEISREAAKLATERLGPANGTILLGDFFSYPFSENSFDAIYERTFLCAISPEQRQDYAQKMSQLLKPNGFLFGFFLFGEESDSPPYPLTEGDDSKLFSSAFEQVESKPSRSPLEFFGEMERWQVWRKKQLAS